MCSVPDIKALGTHGMLVIFFKKKKRNKRKENASMWWESMSMLLLSFFFSQIWPHIKRLTQLLISVILKRLVCHVWGIFGLLSCVMWFTNQYPDHNQQNETLFKCSHLATQNNFCSKKMDCRKWIDISGNDRNFF